MIGGIEVSLMSLRVCALAALVLLPLSSARAEYVPHRGDVLDVAVPSAPALNRRLIVDSDGNITLPFLGQVRATETPLSELGRRVQVMLAAKQVVQRADVIVSVSEYGPIYVDGDVARPGEYRYRPDMTVRSAIALAGGIDPSGGLRGSLTAAQILCEGAQRLRRSRDRETGQAGGTSQRGLKPSFFRCGHVRCLGGDRRPEQ